MKFAPWKASSAFVLFAVLSLAGVAHAEKTKLERLVPLSPLNLLPAGIGPEFSIGARATSDILAVVAWPVQFELNEAEPADLHHRLVVAPELVLGSQHAADPDRTVEGALRARVGYRVVWHPGGDNLGVLAGMGTTFEFWPSFRPSLSPEVGFRLGLPEGIPVGTLIVRCDQFLFGGENPTRVSALVGWSFF